MDASPACRHNRTTQNECPPHMRGTSDSFLGQLGPLLFLTAAFFLTFLSRIVLAPLLPAIEEALQVSHGEAGSLFLLISVGYFISLLGSGVVSSRIMHRNTIILSAVTVGLSLAVASFSKSLYGMRFAFLFLGAAAGFYLPSGIATLTSLISTRHWGKAIAIHELAPNLSFVAAPLLCEALLLWCSWRGILALLGGASMLFALAFALFSRGGEFPGQAPSFSSFRT